MAYSDFTTLGKALDDLDLRLEERVLFAPFLEPVEPGDVLKQYLELTLPSAARGSEKVRSEGIIYPVLTEVKRVYNSRNESQISLFSGENFTVDPSIGLNGVCDFLICRSPLISVIDAPVAVLVEGKKVDIDLGLGQCVAEMVAAMRFNKAKDLPIDVIYGVVSTGTLWRYLKLEGDVVAMDLNDYPLMPLSQTLAKLLSFVR